MTTGVARSAEAGLLGFDSLAFLTPAQLDAAVSFGMKWIGCYLEVITPAYVAAVHKAGLAISPICEARTSQLSATLGVSSAATEVGRLTALDCPTGVHVTIDLEAVQGTAQDAMDYVNAFALGLNNAKFPDTRYIAQPMPLTGAQIYSLPRTHLYWSGASDNPDISCGYSIFQGLPIDYKPAWALGAEIDLDIIFTDRRGRLPTLWYPS